MIGRTRMMPGAQTVDSDCSSTRLPPRMIDHEGQRYMRVEAEALSTGLICAGGGERVAVTVWSTSPSGKPIGLALTFLPDDAMLDVIIDSLTTVRDEQRAVARDQVDAAIAKARVK